MPLNIDWQQILLHLLNFCILGGGLYFLLYKPVKQFMESRTAHYENMEAQAKAALKEAQEAKQEADTARASLRETLQQDRDRAAADMQMDRQRMLDQATRQADLIVEEARKAAKVQKDKAIRDSSRAIRELAISAAEKLALGEDPYDQFLSAEDGRMNHGERT